MGGIVKHLLRCLWRDKWLVMLILWLTVAVVLFAMWGMRPVE